ncbi:hypothetical protein CALVIDRAFT_303332 [Calocera viscosa TUFC12733]|uniref:Uncharacterized protein n=1 Tax=Calocera viscosa (strain TUFC12733) TaxID=1330018 RepID=A0A167IF42_CALVF|nr:hypothetical protein CALVIDRAFT_303332 [Calocera viscosa TUFC12733]
MRKTPYLVALGILLVALVFTILSIALPDWLYAENPPNLPPGVNVRYGLYQRCESALGTVPSDSRHEDHTNFPGSAAHLAPLDAFDTFAGKRIQYNCRPFPVRSACEVLGETFCVLWTTAGYVSVISVVFALAGLVVLVIVSSHLSTRARRRGAWKWVTGATLVHAALQITTMAIVLRLFITEQNRFPDPNTKLYASFWLCVTSIIISLLLTAGLAYTGLAARAGHKWAAGRRPYEPIPDEVPSVSSQVPA